MVWTIGKIGVQPVAVLMPVLSVDQGTKSYI